MRIVWELFKIYFFIMESAIKESGLVISNTLDECKRLGNIEKKRVIRGFIVTCLPCVRYIIPRVRSKPL